MIIRQSNKIKIVVIREQGPLTYLFIKKILLKLHMFHCQIANIVY